jgi:hypothetical protein
MHATNMQLLLSYAEHRKSSFVSTQIAIENDITSLLGMAIIHTDLDACEDHTHTWVCRYVFMQYCTGRVRNIKII